MTIQLAPVSWLSYLGALLLLLVGCAPTEQAATPDLPLADNQPTLLFFLTDN